MTKIRKLALPVGVVNLLLQLFEESANLAVKSIESKNRYFFNLLIESLDLRTYQPIERKSSRSRNWKKTTY